MPYCQWPPKELLYGWVNASHGELWNTNFKLEYVVVSAPCITHILHFHIHIPKTRLSLVRIPKMMKSRRPKSNSCRQSGTGTEYVQNFSISTTEYDTHIWRTTSRPSPVPKICSLNITYTRMVVGMHQRVTFQAIPPSCSQADDRKIKMKWWLSLIFDKNYAGQPNKDHVHTKVGEFIFFKSRPRIQT